MRTHEAVLLEEAVDALNLKPNAIVVDATLGAAGHAHEIIRRMSTSGRYLGIDADSLAVTEARRKFSSIPYATVVQGNFRNLDSILDAQGIAQVDALLADLGWRLEQMGGNDKGFSFLVDEPLIMTYGNPSDYVCAAADILNSWSEEDITHVLIGYGEERYARRIARAIVEARTRGPILRTAQLVSIITHAVPSGYRHGRLHPATRTFQALRIAVNDELSSLAAFIEAGMRRLRHGGRFAIITFHSLEDRIVKHAFKDAARAGLGIVLTKRPVIPSSDEIKRNPRARSAKLRVFEKHET